MAPTWCARDVPRLQRRSCFLAPGPIARLLLTNKPAVCQAPGPTQSVTVQEGVKGEVPPLPGLLPAKLREQAYRALTGRLE